MLLQLIASQPQALVTIVARTPLWVWGLLAALLALGFSQTKDRQAGMVRIALMPVGMAAFSLAGMAGEFRAAGPLAWVLVAWLAATLLVASLSGLAAPAAGTRYEPATRRFALPGSMTPLWLILGIFLTKYAVGVELSLQPALRADAGFALSIAALYGVFNGLFAGRALRLLRLALRPATCSTLNA